ncbi:hypothetical protein BU17DRAFT_37380 [Hysterangium stoloniferum]|nr:hypothetical protein BU17DRAFT_37380 [Hysterangium stoloniferum]
MLFRVCIRVFLLLSGLSFIVASASPPSSSAPLTLRHGHEEEPKHSHAQPLLELNETEILLSHAPDPTSYWLHDFELSHEDGTNNWRGLMLLHVIGMTLAYFVLLPVGISLRSVRHRWHPAVVLAFNIVGIFSAAAASLYKKLTGDLYEGSVHGSIGFFTLVFANVLAAFDTIPFVRRAYIFARYCQHKNIRAFWNIVILDQARQSDPEYTALAQEVQSENEEIKLEYACSPQDTLDRSSIESVHMPSSESETHEWPRSISSQDTFINHHSHDQRHSRYRSTSSNYSDDTLHNPNLPIHRNANDFEHSSRWSQVRQVAIGTAERCLVLLAFAQLLSGITVYSGICRENYLNGCMAHLIKGGIFWCYGLLSFGRYLGAWADLGWAWNRLPSRRARNVPSAETIESGVIFLYGITNVWMERFGAEPGSPFTTKQLQHISIATMFWFAGALGMALESKTFRRWLAVRAISVVSADEQIAAPPSYAGSFNPFPALVIGITGVAMSAHHQTYLFQVQIHALWGFLLTGFAVLRCLTYFFLWLRPPHSALPSRPPSEAIASFFLACGGLVFILSTEQITFAAMRRGMDDMMFFFNFAIAVTCLAFCWIMSIVAFKGWINHRRNASLPNPAAYKPVFNEHVA